MNSGPLKKVIFSSLLLLLVFLGTQCASLKGEVETQEEMVPVKTYPPDYVPPLTEINLEKVFGENRGLKVLEENATTVRDCYRGGVQEKEKGERLLEEGNWEEAQAHFKKSNQYLKVVTHYLPEDEAYRNVYGDHVIIFLPNLLMADNQLKLARIYRPLKLEGEIYWIIWQGREYLSKSLKSVKTAWAFQVEKEFEKESARK
jgi:hypothetical protein